MSQAALSTAPLAARRLAFAKELARLVGESDRGESDDALAVVLSSRINGSSTVKVTGENALKLVLRGIAHLNGTALERLKQFVELSLSGNGLDWQVMADPVSLEPPTPRGRVRAPEVVERDWISGAAATRPESGATDSDADDRDSEPDEDSDETDYGADDDEPEEDQVDDDEPEEEGIQPEPRRGGRRGRQPSLATQARYVELEKICVALDLPRSDRARVLTSLAAHLEIAPASLRSSLYGRGMARSAIQKIREALGRADSSKRSLVDSIDLSLLRSEAMTSAADEGDAEAGHGQGEASPVEAATMSELTVVGERASAALAPSPVSPLRIDSESSAVPARVAVVAAELERGSDGSLQKIGFVAPAGVVLTLVEIRIEPNGEIRGVLSIG